MIYSDQEGFVDPDELAQTMVYSAGKLSYIEVTAGTLVYRKSFTYDGSGNVETISQWERQV